MKLIKINRFSDDRGFFQETYHYEQYATAGITESFVQDNWSRSTKGVLRGLHYQLKHSQSKLISVVRGEIFDVAVDIRKDSPTFGKWIEEILSDNDSSQLYIPKGFAHGFCALSDTVDLIYKCSGFYTPEDECRIRWNDPVIGIKWPDIGVKPVLSDKDKEAPLLSEMLEGDNK